MNRLAFALRTGLVIVVKSKQLKQVDSISINKLTPRKIVKTLIRCHVPGISRLNSKKFQNFRYSGIVIFEGASKKNKLFIIKRVNSRISTNSSLKNCHFDNDFFNEKFQNHTKGEYVKIRKSTFFIIFVISLQK